MTENYKYLSRKLITMSFILTVDVGTTSIKAAIMDTSDFTAIKTNSTRAIVEYPKKHWAEKNPDKLWKSIVDVCSTITDNINVDAVIFGAHMAGVVPVDEESNALRNIIIWLDERAAGLPEDIWRGIIKIEGYSLRKLVKFLRLAGGVPSKTGKDPISKIIWLKDNEPDVFNKTHKILDVRGYLVAKATGNFVTSPDEANLTWLADTRGGRIRWSKSILKDYNLDLSLFPEIKNAMDVAGTLLPEVAGELCIGNVPVIVGTGDVCAAAIGSGAVRDNECHIYIGTSDWVAGHVSKRKTDVFHYIGSLMSAIPGKYLLIAEQEVASGALEWAMKLVGIEGKYELVEEMVRHTDPGKLIFMPWFYGERAPVDDPYVRGGLINVSLEYGRGDVLRAIMEGVALNIKWIYGYVEKMTAKQSEVSIVGGGALFDVWCQMVSSAIKRPVKRIEHPEQTGLRGLATIAAVGLGEDTFESATSKFRVDRVFKPDEREAKIYDSLFKFYKEIYGKLKKVYRKLNSRSGFEN